MKRISQIISPSDKFEEQWTSPEWDRRRKSYLAKHGLWCRSCKRSGAVLQVHHINYTRGMPLADYPDEELVVLCKDCHERWTNLMRAFRRLFSLWNVTDLEMLFGVLKVAKETKSSRFPAIEIMKAMQRDINAPEMPALPPLPKHPSRIKIPKA